MLQTKYITLDEFKEYFSIDLIEEMGDEGIALAFLKRIEDRMEAFVNSNFNRNIMFEYPNFTDYQKEKYKLALLEQCIYIFKNGDITVDSGLDLDRGEVVRRGVLKNVSIAPNAEANLRLCGIWCRQIRSNRAGFLWWTR